MQCWVMSSSTAYPQGQGLEDLSEVLLAWNSLPSLPPDSAAAAVVYGSGTGPVDALLPGSAWKMARAGRSLAMVQAWPNPSLCAT